MAYTVMTRLERRIDLAVHVGGLVFAIGACITLAVLAALETRELAVGSLMAYGAGLLGMMLASAVYNHAPNPSVRETWRPFDHAAIYAMIAGTYTPFCLISLGNQTGAIMASIVWAIAGTGIYLKFRFRRRFERLSILLYLALGWSVVPVLGQAIDHMAGVSFGLILGGGGLYTLGVLIFLSRVPFRIPVWHGLVVAAAALHFSAVIVETVRTAPGI